MYEIGQDLHFARDPREMFINLLAHKSFPSQVILYKF